ncbi:MAG: hypothetical protein JXR83_19025 [Deltaproteobacteria bacterium]|nr:hypothetical protein [Deltaproteobacteria bacterium]
MSALLALGADLFAAPTQAVRRAVQHPSDGLLGALFLWGVLSQLVSQGLVGGGFALGGVAALLGALLSAALVALGASALFHLTASLLGAEGRGAHLLRLFALVFFLNALLPPFALIGGAAWWLARLAVAGWQLALLVVGVREIYAVDTGTALAVVAMPTAVLVLVVPLAALFALGVGMLHLL